MGAAGGGHDESLALEIAQRERAAVAERVARGQDDGGAHLGERLGGEIVGQGVEGRDAEVGLAAGERAQRALAVVGE